MSRRNDYRQAVSWIRYGAYFGLAAGMIATTIGASLTPPGAVFVIAGILLIADGIWVLWAPTSAGVYPLVVALLLIGWAITSGQFPGDADSRAVVLIGIACLVATNYWRVTRGDLEDALTAPPGAEEIKEEQFEDLVDNIRASSMDDDPDRVEFLTWSLLTRTSWQGRLRDDDVVLTSSDGTRPFRTRFAPAPAAFVVAKTDFEIRNARKVWLRRAFNARFRIGDRTFKGRINQDALDRYTRWKKIDVCPSSRTSSSTSRHSRPASSIGV